ncbi:MAG: sulfotransferase family protein [Thermodesulfobacteriota bacterium]
MAEFSLLKQIWGSYRTYFRLCRKTFFRTGHTQARLTVKRGLVMAGFLPLLFIVQSVHWLGFVMDEVLFSGYRKITVKAPLFIVGVPRSGTTFFHRLLAEDTNRFTTVATWELILAPSITERKIIFGLGRVDRWIGAPISRLIGWIEKKAFASLDAIHQISLSDPEEDYLALVPVYACFLLILPFPFPEELGYLARFDDAASPEEKERVMAFYKTCLQRHLYVHGSQRVLLSKNVAFAPMIEALNETFPDCRIIGTVRNPLAAIPSHLSSMASGAAIFGNDTGTAFCEQMIAVQRYAYSHLAQALPSLPDSRRDLLRYEDVKTKPAEIVKSVYHRFGYAIAPEFGDRLHAIDRRQQSYQSGHHYDPAQFGLTEEDIYKRFSDVFDRYGYDAPNGLTRTNVRRRPAM